LNDGLFTNQYVNGCKRSALVRKRVRNLVTESLSHKVGIIDKYPYIHSISTQPFIRTGNHTTYVAISHAERVHMRDTNMKEIT